MMDDNQFFPVIINLLKEQQEVSSRTWVLIESIVRDMGKFRDQTEQIAVLSKRVDVSEKMICDMQENENKCFTKINDQIKNLDEKRESNKDRIVEMEGKLNQTIQRLKDSQNDKMHVSLKEIEARIIEITKTIHATKEGIAYQSGKYGTIAAIIASVGMLLLQYLLKGYIAIDK